MAKRNQYNRQTLSTVVNLEASTVDATLMDADTKTIIGQSSANGAQFTLPTSQNVIMCLNLSAPGTASVDYTGFKAGQHVVFLNVGQHETRISGTVSSSNGIVGINGIAINGTPLNEAVIPARTYVKWLSLATSTHPDTTIGPRIAVYESGSVTS